MIGLIDAGTGNLGSFRNALDYLDIKYTNINKREKISDCDKIILPGVGSFRTLMNNLLKKDLKEGVINFIKEEKPFLGICVGMKILLQEGHEEKKTEGLKIFKGEVKKINHDFKTPIIAWIKPTIEDKNLNDLIFKNYIEKPFYFLHSYFCDMQHKEDVVAYTEFKKFKYPSIIKKKNVYGIQFHPEKSREQGLELIKNFYRI